MYAWCVYVGILLQSSLRLGLHFCPANACVYMFVYGVYAFCSVAPYCHSHYYWEPRNSFQIVLVPVYYWETVEKNLKLTLNYYENGSKTGAITYSPRTYMCVCMYVCIFVWMCHACLCVRVCIYCLCFPVRFFLSVKQAAIKQTYVSSCAYHAR
jgi:hypothetical protein